LLIAGTGATQSRSPRLLFWIDGESWIHPTRCLRCGGNLQPTGEPWHACAECGAHIVIASPVPAVHQQIALKE
jgi:DNA-directed RNA polymerase subunit RPC12/RpoP